MVAWRYPPIKIAYEPLTANQIKARDGLNNQDRFGTD